MIERVIQGDETTMTAVQPSIARAREATLCLAWVYPELGLTPLDSPSISLGRSRECSVCLPGTEASRRHALVEQRGSQCILRDLESKNGTFHNGQPVSEAVISGQDIVRIGEWVAVAVHVPKEHLALGQAVRQLEFDGIGGPALVDAFQQLESVASSNLSVIIVGETGTGKELFAQALHRLSGRRGKLVAINCASVPEHLAEAELFGYRKGAFTGADRDHLGHLREASQGTLFLDEISDLHSAVQAKLLRVLQEGCLTPLGHRQSLPIDIRVVCAAQLHLEDAVAKGSFRADLYARLHGVEIALPPLRARREEVVPLFTRTLSEHSTGKTPALAPDLAERLCLYDWPFNVREVIQAAKRLAAQHGDASTLRLEYLPERMAQSPARSDPARSDHGDRAGSRAKRHKQAMVERNEAQIAELIQALRESAGNVSSAAKKLRISRQRAYRLMEGRPEVDVEALRSDSSDATKH